MSFFKKIGDWFRQIPKEDIEILTDVPKEILDQPQKEQPGYFCDQICELCGKVIGINKYKKIQGKHYHKPCWKNKVNEVKQQGLV